MSRSLFGHVSPETAYIVHNYPFGSGLVCIKRWWIQSTRSGMRVMSQTTEKGWNREYTKTNELVWGRTKVTPPPGGELATKGDEFWNKPKSSTYSDLRVLYLDEDEHVQNTGLSVTSWPKHFADFDQTVGELPEDLLKVRKYLERISRAGSPNTWDKWEKEGVSLV